MKLNRNKIVAAVGIFVFFVIINALFYRYIGFFSVNVYPACINGKYFFIYRLNKKIKDGDYVAFKFKGSKLYKKGRVFLKFVGCSAGQKIITKGYGYYCNGKLIEKACVTHKRCLPGWIKYDETIPKGYFFAEGTTWYSYDSKYWGLASISSIIGRGYKIIGGNPF